MATARPLKVASLREIRNIAALLRFLSDDLDWPVGLTEPDAFIDEDLDDLTWDWDPDELGIRPEQVERLRRLRELRPLTTSQPWGIFVLEFDGSRLPVGQLRRILKALVRTKRAANNPNRRTWDREDLLFVVTSGEADGAEIHMLTFWEREDRVPEIRPLTWPRASRDRRLHRLANELLPHLRWPEDPSDTESWRNQWRNAFRLPLGAAIQSAASLAERMAETARSLRNQIDDALAAEDGDGPFSELLGEVQEQLVAEADEAKFADMCAQTLVYGLLSSRVTDPEGFGASPVYSAVPLANPFLAGFFERVQEEASELDFASAGVERLVADLRATQIEAVLDQFGATARGGDPVIHFYEDFLSQYDKRLRVQAGAFYTPKPIVEFMVRVVDELLRTRFRLQLGIADPATWRDVADNNGFDVPAGIDPERQFVSMIDPATGTGTFLVEWINRAKQSFAAERALPDWPPHLRDHVLPTMHAFELELGPYAIAHLKVALELHTHGLLETGAQILLTNTLEHPAGQGSFEEMRGVLAHEGRRASQVKDGETISLVIGNPPYKERSRGEGAWIESGDPEGGHKAPLEAWRPPTAWGVGAHVKHIYNPYVYFWRWATWKAFDGCQAPGARRPGIVCFITVQGFLTGPGFEKMRSYLRETADEIWVLDLTPEGHHPPADANVFDIRQPVCVVVAVCHGSGSDHPAVVKFRSVREGPRERKFDELAGIDLSDSGWDLCPTAQRALFRPGGSDRWLMFPGLDDLLPWSASGVMPGRTWVIAPTPNVLIRRWQALIDAVSRPKKRELFKEHRTDRRVDTVLSDNLPGYRATKVPIEAESGACPRPIPYSFRTLDRQWIIPDKRLINRPNPALWHAHSDRQMYLTGFENYRPRSGPTLTVAALIPDLHHYRGSGGGRAYPLWRDAEALLPNVAPGLLRYLGDTYGSEVTARTLLAFIAGVASTPAFTDLMIEANAPPGIRVPLTADGSIFREIAEAGAMTVWLQTYGQRFVDKTAGRPPGPPMLPEADRPRVVAPIGFAARRNDKPIYDVDTQTLHIGTGAVAPVSHAAASYEIDTKNVLDGWHRYRRAEPGGKGGSELDDINTASWPDQFTTELLELLNVLTLLSDHHAHQAQLLEKLLQAPQITVEDLKNAKILPVPDYAKKRPPTK